jgi:hypothetical protein
MSIKQLPFATALLTTALLTSSIINGVSAKEIAIYRWVDKNNVVHFSQNLPHGDEYKELSTISSFQALSKAERKIIAEQEAAGKKVEDEDKQRENTIAKNKEVYEKNCKNARLNIKMLNSLDDILISEEKKDGTIGNRALTTAEKAEKLKVSKKQEELYCGK